MFYEKQYNQTNKQTINPISKLNLDYLPLKQQKRAAKQKQSKAKQKNP